MLLFGFFMGLRIIFGAKIIFRIVLIWFFFFLGSSYILVILETSILLEVVELGNIFRGGQGKHNKFLMYKKWIKNFFFFFFFEEETKKILISQINFNLKRLFLSSFMALKSLIIDAKLNWCKQHERSFLHQL